LISLSGYASVITHLLCGCHLEASLSFLPQWSPIDQLGQRRSERWSNAKLLHYPQSAGAAGSKGGGTFE
jgi:hypothetical protein